MGKENRLDTYIERYVGLLGIHYSSDQKGLLEDRLNKQSISVGLAAFSLSRRNTQRSYDRFLYAFDPRADPDKSPSYSRIDNFSIKTADQSKKTKLRVDESESNRIEEKITRKFRFKGNDLTDTQNAARSFSYIIDRAIEEGVINYDLKPTYFSKAALEESTMLNVAETALQNKWWILIPLVAGGAGAIALALSQAAAVSAPGIYTM